MQTWGSEIMTASYVHRGFNREPLSIEISWGYRGINMVMLASKLNSWLWIAKNHWWLVNFEVTARANSVANMCSNKQKRAPKMKSSHLSLSCFSFWYGKPKVLGDPGSSCLKIWNSHSTHIWLCLKIGRLPLELLAHFVGAEYDDQPLILEVPCCQIKIKSEIWYDSDILTRFNTWVCVKFWGEHG